ncbi:uncharacterized protein LOC110371724 [Helicoverpa armigera]|uniref:uncharacterized protein LOC110371724 n=1 Tax=Helicoverpa armigera TaxID=29058 RepID=UPI003083D054
MWAVLKIIIVTFLSLDSTTWALEISLFKADGTDSRDFYDTYQFHFYKEAHLKMNINVKYLAPGLDTEFLTNNWNNPVSYPQTNPKINHSLKHQSTYNVTLKICTKKTSYCIWKTIVKGERVKDSYALSGDDDRCLNEDPCSIVVNLFNITTEYIKQEASRPTGTPKPTSTTSITYTSTVIPDTLQPMECSSGIQTSTVIYIAVAMICLVILLAIIYVKKHRCQNSRPVPPVNFQNSSSPNQVLYAELNLPPAPTDKPPASTCEESPYTEIIGVLKPKPEVSKK